MPDNGVILVFTDTGSIGLELENSIAEKARRKNVKIFFALLAGHIQGGQCWYTWISRFPTSRLPPWWAILRWGILRVFKLFSRWKRKSNEKFQPASKASHCGRANECTHSDTTSCTAQEYPYLRYISYSKKRPVGKAPEIDIVKKY